MKSRKEPKESIEIYEKKLRSTMVRAPLFILFLLGLGVANLIYLPQLWQFSLIFFGLSIVGIICFVLSVGYRRKKLKAMKEASEGMKRKKH